VKKVVYITNSNISKKFLKHWFVFALSKFFFIEIWDVGNIIKSKIVNKYYKTFSKVNYYKFKDSNFFERHILKNKNNKIFFIIAISYYYVTIIIYKLLSKYNLFITFFNWGYQPSISPNKNFLKKLLIYKSFYNSLSFLKIIYKFFISKLYRRVLFIKKFKISFNAGKESNKFSYAEKKININICDYDDFLKSKIQKDIIKKEYSIFLDIDLPKAEDSGILNLKIYKSEEYYSALNKFFSLFEKKLNTKLIIAAHPNRKGNSRLYNGRTVIKDQTAELVKNSSYVLSHHSTSISYAILNYKPLIFIYTNAMIDTYEYTQIDTFSKFLGRGKPICTNNLKFNLSNINSKVNKKKYDLYKYQYIISKDTESKNSSLIIKKEIKNFFNS
jgi:hypothetical protein